VSTVIRLFLLLEGASYVVASLIHSGLIVDGYQHRSASTAEGVIAVVLLVGLALTWVWPGQTRSIGFAVQAFAMLGTLVGAFTIAIGIGPRSIPDLAYHLTMLAVLAGGLVVASGQTKLAPG